MPGSAVPVGDMPCSVRRRPQPQMTSSRDRNTCRFASLSSIPRRQPERAGVTSVTGLAEALGLGWPCLDNTHRNAVMYNRPTTVTVTHTAIEDCQCMLMPAGHAGAAPRDPAVPVRRCRGSGADMVSLSHVRARAPTTQASRDHGDVAAGVLQWPSESRALGWDAGRCGGSHTSRSPHYHQWRSRPATMRVLCALRCTGTRRMVRDVPATPRPPPAHPSRVG